MTEEKKILCAGLMGLLASLLVGVGEFLMHFPTLAHNASIPFGFFQGVELRHLQIGHFIAVLAAPLYLVGYWHIFQMLKSANEAQARFVWLLGSYGFVIGSIWIGSRANLGHLIHFIVVQPTDLQNHLKTLTDFYSLSSETLLWVIRVTTLLTSGLIIKLILSGNSQYPKMAFLTAPIIPLLSIFAIYFALPSIGQYLLPAALNVAHFIFFAASLIILNINKKR